jgi:hypothetical protein
MSMCYALYKGDKFINLGSKKFLAKFIDVDERTITFYGTPTYKKRGKQNNDKRYIVIKIEGEDKCQTLIVI